MVVDDDDDDDDFKRDHKFGGWLGSSWRGGERSRNDIDTVLSYEVLKELLKIFKERRKRGLGPSYLPPQWALIKYIPGVPRGLRSTTPPLLVLKKDRGHTEPGVKSSSWSFPIPVMS